MDDLLAVRVHPFHKQMMGLNATAYAAEVIPAVRASRAEVSADEVRALLAADWRPRVMGAWYASAHASQEVDDALARSLETSAGLLTAPPLATVASLVLGADALPALTTYARRAAGDPSLGADGFVAAAIERLEGPVDGSGPSPTDRDLLDRMIVVAESVMSNEWGAAPLEGRIGVADQACGWGVAVPGGGGRAAAWS